MEPSSFEQLRKGCYDVHARIDDMDVNGIAASMCFGNSIGFDGQTFHKAPDKKLALHHLQAYSGDLGRHHCDVEAARRRSHRRRLIGSGVY